MIGLLMNTEPIITINHDFIFIQRRQTLLLTLIFININIS